MFWETTGNHYRTPLETKSGSLPSVLCLLSLYNIYRNEKVNDLKL